MEKKVAQVTYWLGIICAGVAVILRANAAFGLSAFFFKTNGNPVGSYSFLHASILFFVWSIATACVAWTKKQGS
jgi:hypothetical protein